MGNIRKWLINVVRTSKPKLLTGLNQKVRGWLYGLPLPDTQTEKPPANRPAPNPSIGQLVKRGKPVILPQGTVNRKANLWNGGQKMVEQAKAVL